MLLFSFNFFYPCYSYVGLGGNDGSGSGDWVYVSGVADQDQQVQLFPNPDVTSPSYAKNVLTEDLQQKIIKQVKFDTYEDCAMFFVKIMKVMHK